MAFAACASSSPPGDPVGHARDAHVHPNVFGRQRTVQHLQVDICVHANVFIVFAVEWQPAMRLLSSVIEGMVGATHVM